MPLNIVNGTALTQHLTLFRKIKKAILGDAYRLTLIIASAARMQKLNDTYRDKNVPTDILSFPLGKAEGDMYLCMSESRKEAIKFNRTSENFIPFLFIHGCVHLKGYDHSATMERLETKFRKQFKI